MSERKGVVLVFFDLPVMTKEQRRIVRRFVRFLKKNGFMMLQESVYVKLIGSGRNPESDLSLVRKNAPEHGTICTLPMSLTLFKNSLFLGDSGFDFSVFADDFLVV